MEDRTQARRSFFHYGALVIKPSQMEYPSQCSTKALFGLQYYLTQTLRVTDIERCI